MLARTDVLRGVVRGVKERIPVEEFFEVSRDAAWWELVEVQLRRLASRQRYAPWPRATSAAMI